MKKIAIFALAALLALPTNVSAAICTPFDITIISSSNSEIKNGGTATNAYVSPLWTTLSGSDWIWSSKFVTDPNVDQAVVFSEKVTIDGVVNNATLSIAADDYYRVTVNNNVVASDFSEIDESDLNFSNIATYDLASAFQGGVNNIEISVTNAKYPTYIQDWPEGNPAGVLYRFSILGEKCESEEGSSGGGSRSRSSGRNSNNEAVITPSETTSSGEVLGVTAVGMVSQKKNPSVEKDEEGEVLGVSTAASEDVGVNEEVSNRTHLGIRCILIALFAMLLIYIIGEIFIGNRNYRLKRSIYFTIMTAVFCALIIVLFNFCPIIPFLILYGITLLGVNLKLI